MIGIIMTGKKIFLIALLMVFAANTNVWAQPASAKKNMLRRTEPIEIVSDKMEAFQEKNMIVFSGKAVATQGDIKLKTDRLSIFYKKSNEKKDKIGKQEVAEAGDLDIIEAKGNVIITQKDLVATGEEAVYTQESAQFVLTGKPVLQQGKNVIKGCRVIVYANENKGTVEPCSTENSGRVTAIIHPEKKNK